MIEVNNLTFSYSEKSPLFSTFNLIIGQGESWAVIGPSGCGKSTLLYLLAGLKHPSAGSIRIAGKEVTRPRPQTGLVLQDHGLLPWATVRRNVALGITIRKFYGPDGIHAPPDMNMDPKATEAQVDFWLDWLGIGDLQHSYPSQLSRGQRQRTAIARTLVLAPDLLLMDEPFSALDAPIRIELQHVMTHFHRQSDMTSVIVTHDIEEAVFLGRKILIFSRRDPMNAQVSDNPLAGQPEARHTPDFQDQCHRLHAILEGTP